MVHLIDKYSMAISVMEVLMFPLVIGAANQLLKAKHTHELYVIWYINSFSFVLFFGMGFIAEKKNKHLEEVCGSYENACKSIYDYLTGFEDEIIIVSAFTALALLPQLLTYLLSGIYGTASPPRFVAQIQAIAVWSIVKFMAGLSGILTAAPMARWATGKSADFFHFTTGLGMLAIAFSYASIHVIFTEWLANRRETMVRENGLVARIHRFFTRNIAVD